MTPYNKDNQGKPFNYVKPQTLAPFTDKEKQAALDKRKAMIKESRVKLNKGN